MAYSLQDPVNAKNKSKLLFISDKVSTDGLYEKVYHPKVRYDDMLASYYLLDFIEDKKRETYNEIKKVEPRPDGKYSKTDEEILQNEFVLHSTFHILSIFNIVLSKKFDAKSVNGRIISGIKNNKISFIETSYDVITRKLKNFINQKQQKDQRLSLTRYFKTTTSLELINLF